MSRFGRFLVYSCFFSSASFRLTNRSLVSAFVSRPEQPHYIATTTSSSRRKMSSTTDYELFGRFKIPHASIFYRSKRSFAFVNLRPIVPGHVLVVPNRIVQLLADLDDEEYCDMWLAVRKVQELLKEQYGCDAFNVAVQDGKAAGQSVPHVHVHILPRKRGDLERNDDIYDELQSWAPRDELRALEKLEVAEDDDRRDRTPEQMAEEAKMYRELAEKLFREDE